MKREVKYNIRFQNLLYPVSIGFIHTGRRVVIKKVARIKLTEAREL